MIDGLVFGDPEVQDMFQEEALDIPDDDQEVPPWREDPLVELTLIDSLYSEDGRRRRGVVFMVHAQSRERQARIEEALELGYFVDRLEREDIVRSFGGRCVYCGASGVPLVLDHVHPIARGGRHTRDNLAPACEHCNGSKRAKTLERWMEQHGEVFAAEVAARLKAGWAPRGTRGKAD